MYKWHNITSFINRNISHQNLNISNISNKNHDISRKNIRSSGASVSLSLSHLVNSNPSHDLLRFSVWFARSFFVVFFLLQLPFLVFFLSNCLWHFVIIFVHANAMLAQILFHWHTYTKLAAFLAEVLTSMNNFSKYVLHQRYSVETLFFEVIVTQTK